MWFLKWDSSICLLLQVEDAPSTALGLSPLKPAVLSDAEALAGFPTWIFYLFLLGGLPHILTMQPHYFCHHHGLVSNAFCSVPPPLANLEGGFAVVSFLLLTLLYNLH